MFTRIKLIANVKRDTRSNYYTYYFFSHKYKALLPVPLCKKSSVDCLCTCFIKILRCFKICITRVLIYRFDGTKYYSYLMIESSDNTYEMNFELSELLDIHSIFNCPIYIKHDILINNGIRVTKKMVLNALKEDLYLK